MKPIRAFALLLPLSLSLVVASCAPDPVRGRLSAGDEALIFNPDPADPLVSVHIRPDGGGQWVHTRVGTKSRVIGDDSPSTNSSRMVRVNLLDGPDRGFVGYVARAELRPTK